MFDLHLLQLLRRWRAEGDEIILVGDLNIHVYNNPLAHALKAEDIRLEEQFNMVFDEDVPFLHFTGLKPIASFFATPGIDCVTAYVSKHKVNGGPGVGDHRVMIFDFSAKSIMVSTLLLPTPQRRGNFALEWIVGGSNTPSLS